MLPIWKLLGFILYIVLYFSLFEPYDKWPPSSLKSNFFKVLPVAHLILVIVSTSTEEEYHTKSRAYRRFITLGLMFSVAGSSILWDYFRLGTILFAVAQALYILAFGFRPLGSGPMAASFGVIGTAVYVYVVTDLKEDTGLKALLLVYTVLILVMAWRATAQFSRNMTVENFCGCAGAALFVVSDLILVVDKWKGSFHHAPFWNMMTYFIAQLGIALSACNTRERKFYSHVVEKNK